jgi:4-carboxymuconolactone decarboxylase
MQDRMPPIADADLTPDQREAATELASGPRGAVFGPFVPLLRSPELMRRVQKTGEYLRYSSALPPRLSEFVILIVARWWGQGFEWHVHSKIAADVGVAKETIDAIAEGRRPSAMTTEEEIVYEFCTELHVNRAVSDRSYARMLALFGERGVIDLTGLCGYYGMLAMVMNVARTPVPEGAEGAESAKGLRALG